MTDTYPKDFPFTVITMDEPSMFGPTWEDTEEWDDTKTWEEE